MRRPRTITAPRRSDMAVFAPGDTPDGTGYDPNSGWPPDDSTRNVWDNDVDLRGYQFGRGGFHLNPRLIGPASGPAPGVSLSANPHGDGPSSPIIPDEVIPPNTRPIAPNRQVGPFTGGSATDATFPAPAGRPWWLPSLGPLGLGAAAGSAALTAINNENQPGNVPAHGTGPPDVMSPEEIYRRQHGQPAAPGYRPEDDPRYTVAPSAPYRPEDDPRFTAPNPYGAGMPRGTPLGSPAPAVPPSRPVAAPGGAVARQRPNLGTYGAPPAVVPNSPFTTLDYRPNSGPNERNRGSPVATALDLSRFFGGGQPAPTAAAPRYVTTADPTRGPPVTPGLNPSGNLVLAGGNATPGVTRSVPAPYPPARGRRPKSSSTSQGGGY